MSEIGKPVLVHWKQYFYAGYLIRRTNHGKACLVKLANGLVVQVRPERIHRI